MTPLTGYLRRRDLLLFDTVGVCALTKEQFVREAFCLPTQPLCATIFLAGVPAVISAKRDAAIAEVYNSASITAIDGMPIVRMARQRGYTAERCAGARYYGADVQGRHQAGENTLFLRRKKQ